MQNLYVDLSLLPAICIFTYSEKLCPIDTKSRGNAGCISFFFFLLFFADHQIYA